MLDPKVKSLMGESYRRAYPCILELQYLKELEEIIEYKKIGDEDAKKHLKDIWSYRLEFMAQDVESLQKTLNLRSLVIDISEDTNHYVTLAELCNKKGNPAMCKRILSNLKSEIESNPAAYPKEQLYNISKVNFGLLKYEYTQGNNERAINGLKLLIRNEKRIDPLWYITLGNWQKDLNERDGGLKNKDFKQIINYFEKATEIDKQNNIAWHYYALANYEASKLLEGAGLVSKKENKKQNEEYIFYVVSAVNGLIQSISLGEQDVTKTLQDTLRLLKLWFKHGSVDEIDKLIRSGFSIVGVEVWTQVIPQLLARIDINAEKTKNTMIELLKMICDTYPQTMIYPVSVLSQSNTENRKAVAHELIEMMRRNQKKLINQALKISRELIRAAVLQTESWCEALEEAAMMYFANNDVKKMIDVLTEQYKLFNDPPQTMSEIAFHQNYR
jgi:FKBP12-rapamycin complex-associated protein